jgi:hypothetical protein
MVNGTVCGMSRDGYKWTIDGEGRNCYTCERVFLLSPACLTRIRPCSEAMLQPPAVERHSKRFLSFLIGRTHVSMVFLSSAPPRLANERGLI